MQRTNVCAGQELCFLAPALSWPPANAATVLLNTSTYSASSWKGRVAASRAGRQQHLLQRMDPSKSCSGRTLRGARSMKTPVKELPLAVSCPS